MVKSPRGLLWLVAIGFFMETLDSTIVNTALPAMARSLNENPLFMQSVVIAYALTLALFIPASGWLADKFGTRRVFMAAIFIFTLGSALCAVSRNLTELVLARVLQGVGGSMLMPVGRLSVLRAFPGDQYLGAISFVAVPALIGPLVGPTLGGWLVEYASWHWIFLINLPIGIAGFFATRMAMPDFRATIVPRFDLVGFLQISASMVLISFALDGFTELGFTFATASILSIFGFMALVAYVIHAARAPNPLFSLKLFRTHSFSVGLLGNFFARIGSGGMPLLIPLMLQVLLKYTPFEAGIRMIPVAGAAIAAKKIAPSLLGRLGYRKFLIGNTFVIGLLIVSFGYFSRDLPIVLQVAQLLLFGTFNSLQFTAMNTLTMKDLVPETASSGNSLFSMVQMLAMGVAMAITGAVLAGFAAHFEVTTHPERLRMAFRMTFLCAGILTCASAGIFSQLAGQFPTPVPTPEAEVVGVGVG